MDSLANVKHIEIIKEVLQDDGQFPNNRLPLLVYKKVFPKPVSPSDFQELFSTNHWTNSWRNGIYPYHHYHSISHEVLGIYGGTATVQMGGPNGISLEVNPGDVIIIPAGVAHKNLGASGDFACIGAYPGGSSYDMNYGNTGERPAVDKNILNVKLPERDPVYGSDGPLVEQWATG